MNKKDLLFTDKCISELNDIFNESPTDEGSIDGDEYYKRIEILLVKSIEEARKEGRERTIDEIIKSVEKENKLVWDSSDIIEILRLIL